ncbi:unnamed protein product, partial [Timema podura]|nr:unnamed protein product [Timema podura]
LGRLGSLHSPVGTTKSPPTESVGTGYSVSFVPLFSLLANFLPKMLARFNGFSGLQPPGSRSETTAASIRTATPGPLLQPDKAPKATPEERTVVENDYIQVKGSICSPLHLGQWRDLSNCRQYYVCELSAHASEMCRPGFTRHEMSRQSNNIDDEEVTKGLKIEALSNSCVSMIVYKCPRRFVYNDVSESCEPGQSQLCQT